MASENNTDTPPLSGSKKLGLALLVFVVFMGGFWVRGCFVPTAIPMNQISEEETAPQESTLWTCSMHPQIQELKPGKCRLCGMDLIPLENDDSNDNPRVFATSEASAALMNIQTVPVERKFVEAEIRMVGKVEYDETRLADITAWVPGRIDNLYVDYTGVQVQKGDHLVRLYSPELISAQEELRQALKTSQNLTGIPRTTALATLEATRERLRNWGLTEEQIKKAEEAGEYSDHVTIYAPLGGTVIHRNGQEGMYVKEGTPIYTLADLSQMWVSLDAYESDLVWLRYGQSVNFETEALPGETFEGMVVFIDPFLDPTTRTARVRVNIPNPDGKLKPEMFVRGVVHSRVAKSGRVMNADMLGKWVCPMHPEVIQNEPGDCSICGMPLEPTEELGYLAADDVESAKPLVIPVTAALKTGTRAVVYVEVPNMDRPTFEGREVELGPRAGDYYLVSSGLMEGEKVVVNGNFKIDSALQILAKPSMMSPDTDMNMESSPEHMHAHDTSEMVMDEPNQSPTLLDTPSQFRDQLREVFTAYTALSQELANDDYDNSQSAIEKLANTFNQVDMHLLSAEAHQQWMPLADSISDAIEQIRQAEDIEACRTDFEPLSMHLATAIEQFGIAAGEPVFRIHCPMAFSGKGADWLQPDESVKNPYYGESMLTCGNVVERIDENP